MAMFGKICVSFFDSSICETDPITRLVFIGMIVLSDRNGRLDATTQALARRLNLPHEAILIAIDTLSAPDHRSRSTIEEGRRIVPLDPARAWGWVVVNKQSYRDAPVRDDEEIRRQNRERKARQRGKEVSSGTTEIKRTDTDTDTDTESVTVTPRHALSRLERDMSVIDQDVTEAAAEYNRLATEWDRPKITPRGLSTIAPKLAKVRAAIQVEIPEFTMAEAVRRIRDQEKWFRVEWRVWTLKWFTHSKDDEFNAAKTWRRVYGKGEVRSKAQPYTPSVEQLENTALLSEAGSR